MNAKNVAFFDMDGTITVPLYKYNGKLVTGFPLDEWNAFIKKEQEHAYDNVELLMPVLEYANSLKSRGWDCKILTSAAIPEEEKAKIIFVRNDRRLHVFSDILFVKYVKDKPDYILEYAKRNHMRPDQCILVEDSAETAWTANRFGIRTMLLSHVCSKTYDAAED